MKYNHILVATDLSSISQEVVKKAVLMAQECGADINIVHVIEQSPMAYASEFSLPVNVDFRQAIETEARKQLNKLAESVKISPDRQHLLCGAVKVCVVDLADELNVDLIVVGTHSYHGVDRLLGSRANAILHCAKCDVLAVRVEKKD